MSKNGGILRKNGNCGTHEALIFIAHSSEVQDFGTIKLADMIKENVFNSATHKMIYCVVCFAASLLAGALGSLGQILANELQVPVRAGTDVVYVNLSDPMNVTTSGFWVDFQPQSSIQSITGYLSNLII